jgi:hypothetical protein
MVVDAVLSLDELMPLDMIGIKKIQGGALEVNEDFIFFFHRFKFFCAYLGVPIGTRCSFQEDFLLCRI